VDAGGLSREFFAILAKEMFNPNYALFMSTEDGCTFQPNPNSSINLDDLNYFRFVGRIVGKAVTDGFLLDAHFTRSLYKHMLGIKVKLNFPAHVFIVSLTNLILHLFAIKAYPP
jgi:E3 ubiquitin-protein ligase HUWE1